MVVLDAWAVLALLDDEPAAPRVEQAIVREGGLISQINLGEVLYSTIPRRGERRAMEAVDALARELSVEAVDWPLVIAAAHVKAAHRLSYADAFCVVTAQRHRARLYTGDPEILALDAVVEVVDLRSQRSP